VKGYWKIAFSCENGSLDRQWSTRTHRCVARLPRADAAVRRGPWSGDDGRARCGGVCKRAGAGMRVLAEVGELRAQAARRIPVSWALADPPCPTIMDAAAFRPPASPSARRRARRRSTGGGRRDGPPGVRLREARHATLPAHPKVSSGAPAPRACRPRVTIRRQTPCTPWPRAPSARRLAHPHAGGRGDGQRAAGGRCN